ncbi:MAG: hypothetical protein M3Z35_11960, partial [Nitrospirota bacterium]|nr:hypothetical protein [Nitrospirota bacterium]
QAILRSQGDPIKPRICKCFEIHLLDGSNVSAQEKLTLRLSNISADLVEVLASHTERQTMRMLRYYRMEV